MAFPALARAGDRGRRLVVATAPAKISSLQARRDTGSSERPD
jgi:hypothetical protein